MLKVKTLKSFTISGKPLFREGVEYFIDEKKAKELESRGLVKVIIENKSKSEEKRINELKKNKEEVFEEKKEEEKKIANKSNK